MNKIDDIAKDLHAIAADVAEIKGQVIRINGQVSRNTADISDLRHRANKSADDSGAHNIRAAKMSVQLAHIQKETSNRWRITMGLLLVLVAGVAKMAFGL
jgi:septal ring factor EnvC (AmiA/AmiB activator)